MTNINYELQYSSNQYQHQYWKILNYFPSCNYLIQPAISKIGQKLNYKSGWTGQVRQVCTIPTRLWLGLGQRRDNSGQILLNCNFTHFMRARINLLPLCKGLSVFVKCIQYTVQYAGVEYVEIKSSISARWQEMFMFDVYHDDSVPSAGDCRVLTGFISLFNAVHCSWVH